MSNPNDRLVITGGTGTFGNALLERGAYDRVTVFSRDELKQAEMSKRHPWAEFVLGDVRDTGALRRLFRPGDWVIHAAALKRIDTCARFPEQAVQTNVIGTMNVVHAAIQAGVSRLLLISTDKACEPSTTYGMTKAVAEQFVRANAGLHANLAVLRYGNVFGSRGSFVDQFWESRRERTGMFRVRDPAATRFHLTDFQAAAHADYVLKTMEKLPSGIVVVPKLPAYRVVELAYVMMPNADVDDIERESGRVPGEKTHEALISEWELPEAWESENHYALSQHHPGLGWCPKIRQEPETSEEPAWGLLSPSQIATELDIYARHRKGGASHSAK